MTDDLPLIPSMTDPDEMVDSNAPTYQPVYRSDDPATTFLDAGPPAPFTSPPGAPVQEPTGTGAPPAAARDRVTCPECGAVQDVYLNRRDAVDFCHNCDFPLFWTPSDVVRDLGAGDGDALRRLPGTVGRTTLASMACPNCAELNLVSAQVCVRCGQPMHPVVEAPPPPEPIYIPPPPVVEPEPEHGVPWWVWVLVGGIIAAMIVVGVLVHVNVIN